MSVIHSRKIFLVLFITSALLLMSNVFATGDAKLNRLITTSSERSIMDEARNKKSFNSETVVEKKVDEAKKEASENVSRVVVNGFITRSEGENVVWINDQSTLNSSLSSQGIHVNTDRLDKNTVHLSMTGRRVKMKPGQTIRSNDGKVIEVYEVKEPSQEMTTNSNLFDGMADKNNIIDKALKLYGRDNSYE